MDNYLQDLKIEDLIWIVYIFIAIFAIVSNYYEKKYYYFKIYTDKQKYRYINTTIFTIAIIIYLYFLHHNYQQLYKDKYAFLNLFASALFVVAGVITLYSEFKHAQDEGIFVI